MAPKPLSVEARFWRNVNVGDSCWLWGGRTNKSGYGLIKVDGKPRGAHRISWELHFGEIPQTDGYHGMCVLHKCDVKACVNPSHLFLGTHQENMKDMVEKGRQPCVLGVRNGQAKLNPTLINEIKNLYETGSVTQKELGKQFGVDQSVISDIVTNKIWRQV